MRKFIRTPDHLRVTAGPSSSSAYRCTLPSPIAHMKHMSPAGGTRKGRRETSSLPQPRSQSLIGRPSPHRHTSEPKTRVEMEGTEASRSRLMATPRAKPRSSQETERWADGRGSGRGVVAGNTPAASARRGRSPDHTNGLLTTGLGVTDGHGFAFEQTCWGREHLPQRAELKAVLGVGREIGALPRGASGRSAGPAGTGP